ncbi:unnamed protein product [Timema podura]|uniref:Large ribosomal subunit protein mL62 n=1 Tax=Timema podura TaxID=61482 RepID=A0ABN7PED6_TIMPD|nr:unnamed protein product [Timema podura]
MALTCAVQMKEQSLSRKSAKRRNKLKFPTIVSVLDELTVTYSRSSGPGGQNVNKVNTKVDLRFHVKSASLDHGRNQNKTRINKDGFLIIRSDKTRYQQLNLADAMERLRELVRAAAEPPGEISPETEEKLRRR